MTTCGGNAINRKSISTHILTKRMTRLESVYDESVKFQLTSSRRGWRRKSKGYIDIRVISTHILTKRMTKPFSPLVGVTDISTHILTKRMTIDIASVIPPKIISTHILTKRMTRIRCPDSTDIAFQLTSSRRGWRRHWIHFFWIGDISTHILTKRMTISTICCVPE